MKLRSSLTFLLISTFTCVQHAHADLPLSGPDSWIEVKLRGHSENHVISRMTSAATANGMSCTHDGTGMPICGFEPGSYFAIQPAIGPKVVRFIFYYQSDDSPNIDPSRRHTIDLVVQEFVASQKDSRQVLRVVLCDAPSGRIGVLCSGKLLLDRIADDCDTVGYCSGGVGDDNIARACSVADNQRLIDESRVVSGDKGFCTRLMNSHWHYWPLAETHTVTEDEASEFLELRGSHMDIDPHAGFFDIDNDGKPEHLTRISSYSGAGQGCDVEEYVEMSRRNGHICCRQLSRSCLSTRNAKPMKGHFFSTGRPISRTGGSYRLRRCRLCFLLCFRRSGSSKATRNDLSVTSPYSVALSELPPVSSPISDRSLVCFAIQDLLLLINPQRKQMRVLVIALLALTSLPRFLWRFSCR